MPHWEVDQTFYFITYRLADSLPKHVIHQLRAEYRAAKRALGDKISLDQQAHLSRWFHRRLDEFLDEGRGACHLKNPRAAQCVVNAWKYFDRSFYDLIAWCVMPNHAHVVARIFNGRDLDSILHSWKSYTSNEINFILRRSGKLWFREYFDYCIRDEDDLSRCVRYVIENPAKAGLVDWP
ncbi:MAG TPA: transposase, partial [Thermoanaerobaculia bacterium]